MLPQIQQLLYQILTYPKIDYKFNSNEFINEIIIAYIYFVCWMHFLYFSFCFFFDNIFLKFISKSKIQKEVIDWEVRRREIMWSSICLLVGASFLATLSIGRKYGKTAIYYTPFEYGSAYMFVSVAGMWLVNDTWQYFTHRLLHHRSIFPYAHAVHHSFHCPTVYSTMAFHPLEAIVQFFPIMLAFVFPIYYPLMLLASFGVFVISTAEHCGYYVTFYEDFSWLFATPGHHDLHHSLRKCNYAVYFSFWDRICGTELTHKQHAQ
eukprot:TRINITY_DN88_c1_g1_i1.p1 TRINITY_DN88_c1_g1~~TRINITY_DN88_c1_g1_i1.p1  ORF type:complete len:264 (-),score=82.59 TRINITY_DN88_c1_g1_i1:145-936(-)